MVECVNNYHELFIGQRRARLAGGSDGRVTGRFLLAAGVFAVLEVFRALLERVTWLLTLAVGVWVMAFLDDEAEDLGARLCLTAVGFARMACVLAGACSSTTGCVDEEGRWSSIQV